MLSASIMTLHSAVYGRPPAVASGGERWSVILKVAGVVLPSGVSLLPVVQRPFSLGVWIDRRANAREVDKLLKTLGHVGQRAAFAFISFAQVCCGLFVLVRVLSPNFRRAAG
jgi:hypothetical protein